MNNGKTIKVFNNGAHRPDFTYIDDIVEGIMCVLDCAALPNPFWSGDNPYPGTNEAPWPLYNIGKNRPGNLMKYIGALENGLGKEANKEFLPMQPRDVPDTWANVQDLVQ